MNYNNIEAGVWVALKVEGSTYRSAMGQHKHRATLSMSTLSNAVLLFISHVK